MVRRVSRILFTVCVGLGSACVAEAHGQLVMPFDCGVKSGVVKVTPAAAKSYPIIGRRDEQPVTLCGLSQSAPCRTITAHRFTISCGGSRVSWMRVVGAIQRAATMHSWIESGRLKFVLPARQAPGSRPTCFDHRSDMRAGAGLQRPLVLVGDCLPWRRRSVYDQIVLPAGYAPLGELGARFLIAGPEDDAPSANDATLNVPGLSPLVSVSAAADETVMAKADLGAMIEPLPDPVTYEAGSVAAPATDPWVTVVRSDPDYGTQTRAPGEAGPGASVWFLIAMALATLAVAVRARSAFTWPIRLFAFVPSLPTAIGRFRMDIGSGLGNRELKRNLANAGASVASLLEQTDAVVSQVKGAGPLREVLLSELNLVRQRLVSAESLAAGRDTAERVAQQFRALIRDLERIRRIADSAAASLLGSRSPSPLPRTASEAYDVLGVNPDVSKDVLKRIVDALRMSWHPDHARDEDDRCVREDRIRRINVALDLINEKREVS